MKVKLSIFITLIATMTSIGGVLGMLGTAGRILSERYHVPYPVVIQNITPPGIASTMVALFIASPIAAVYGKRIQIFFGLVGVWIDMLAGIFANSLSYYRSLSVMNGIWMAPVELLLAPVTTDIVFVHQRGRFIALAAVIRDIGSDASHVIAGNIIARLGVKYLYIISFGVLFPVILCVFFLVRETTFVRPPRPNLSIGAASILSEGSKNDDAFVTTDKKTNFTAGEAVELASVATGSKSSVQTIKDPVLEPKHTLKQNLRLFRGRITQRSLKRSFFQPFPIIILPHVVFATMVHGSFITWFVSATLIQHQLLLFPPYNIKPDVLSYLSLPGSAANLITALFAGALSDWLIQFIARHNNGIYEPEFRLLMLFPATICTTLGFGLMGPLYAAKAPVWQIVVAGLLFHTAGPFASSATMPYIFDTMQSASTEAFVAISLFRHVFLLLATSYIPPWLEHQGPLKVHRTLMVMNLCVASTAIPMYFFGKRLRGKVYRVPFLRRATETHD
jgi:hypothetical protein